MQRFMRINRTHIRHPLLEDTPGVAPELVPDLPPTREDPIKLKPKLAATAALRR